ncbi:MAG: ABC transporter ATP-binding protein/permease [Chloroflexi bacterium]|nr:ABC transporter ATP-binding protein/permease [Chloroflexota bacterium]
MWFSVFEKDLKALENNIDTFVGSKGVKLSGGQKQRVATARMLITDSDLLIIDDLSSALDVETEKTIWERITTLPQKTILAVSTRPAALQRADRIIVLKDGEIESTGTFQELLETSEEFTDLVAQWQGQ